MSKTIITLLFLTGLVALCSSIVCLPNFCENVKCQDVTEESCQLKNSLYVPKGSFCGCCPACVSLPKVKVYPPGDVPVKLCPLPFIGTKQGFYPC